GFLAPQAGRAALPARRRMSCLLLPFGFIAGTLKDNADYARLDRQRRRRFADLAARLGLEDELDRDPASLSEGEKKKFQTILTLLKDADFYVSDEPLANVDTGSRDAVMDVIFEHTRGKALLVVMHGDERFGSRFDRELVLERGHGLAVVSAPLA